MRGKEHCTWLPVVMAALFVITAVPVASADVPELQVTRADHGRQIKVDGHLVVIQLESNPSTGYGWYARDLDKNVLRKVDEQWAPHRNDGRVGASGISTLRFAAVAPGAAELDLAYRRPWEPGAKAAPDFTVSVQVIRPTPQVFIPRPQFSHNTLGSFSTDRGTLPTYKSWCDEGMCTPVRDQGSCGSCWAFGTVGPMESVILMAGLAAQDLSEQYLVSCNTDGWGCDGGWFAHQYHLDATHPGASIPPGEDTSGAVYEADFPYSATDEACNSPYTHQESLSDWFYVNYDYYVPPVDQIKQAIYDNGPVVAAVCVDSNFQQYTGGVFAPHKPCRNVNHAIVLVGWDDNDQAWILRNSWGPGWGENGYMRIGYGISQVGYDANYVILSNLEPACTVDGDCATGEICCSGSCVVPPTCPSCDDGNECTSDSCDTTDPCNPVCVSENLADGTTCADGTGWCTAGECFIPECMDDADCNDGIGCTDDTCVDNLCSYTANDTNCPDDGLYCTGTEYCDPDLGCQSSGDPCASGTTCNEDTDSCDGLPSYCGDGLCEGSLNGEDCRTCPDDCPSGPRGVCCGDGKCDTRKGETADMCPVDCL